MNSTKLRVFEAFAGYGSQSIALRNIGVNFEIVGISEIDKAAIIAYDCLNEDRHTYMHNNLSFNEMYSELASKNIGLNFKTNKVSLPKKYSELEKLYYASVQSRNIGDISLVDPKNIPDHDLFTYSFPCQDISVGGLEKGMIANSGTRSSLLWECKKIILEKRPKYLLMENVKNILSKTHKPQFNTWCNFLSSLGYKNTYKILDSVNFGIPQSRPRCFMISTLDPTDDFKMDYPKLTNDLQTFISNDFSMQIKPSCRKVFDRDLEKAFLCEKDIFYCNVSSGFQDCKLGLKKSPALRAGNSSTHILKYTYNNSHELSKVLFKRSTQEKVILKSDLHLIDELYSNIPNITTVIQKLKKAPNTNVYENICKELGQYKRLTVYDNFKLMGLSEKQIKSLIDSNLSPCTLLKLAGNSIVINVLESIFQEMFTEN